MRGLKQSANSLTDEASQLRYKLSQAKGQQELLQSQIVHVSEWGFLPLQPGGGESGGGGQTQLELLQPRTVHAWGGGTCAAGRAVGPLGNGLPPRWMQGLLAAAG